jgi:hypothetical protein
MGAMGTCPNCGTELALSASECTRCPAVFGPHSEWQVRPK